HHRRRRRESKSGPFHPASREEHGMRAHLSSTKAAGCWLVATALTLIGTSSASAQSLFDLAEFQRAPEKSETPQDYPLTEAQGPVMVRVVSLTGENGDELANALANELRKEHGVEAYTFR